LVDRQHLFDRVGGHLPDLGPLAFVARALGDEVDRPVVDVQDLLVDDAIEALGVALLLRCDCLFSELSDRLLGVGVRRVVVPEDLQGTWWTLAMSFSFISR